MVITYTEYIAEYESTACEVANPARGQLTREDKYFPVCSRSRFRVWSRDSLYFQGLSRLFYCSRGPSLVELTGDDNSATSTVAVIRISLKEYAWPSHKRQ